LTLLALYIPVTFRGERQVQEFVENGNRKAIGEYLAAVMAPDQTVGSESLGYIGYYSRRIVYDYPGLCSRKVTQYVRTNPEHRSLLEMVHALQPDYLVLRPEEVLSASASQAAWLREDYELVHEFRVPEAQVKQMVLPKNYDLEFNVYKHKSSGQKHSSEAFDLKPKSVAQRKNWRLQAPGDVQARAVGHAGAIAGGVGTGY
jgi:hypothetical protein